MNTQESQFPSAAQPVPAPDTPLGAVLAMTQQPEGTVPGVAAADIATSPEDDTPGYHKFLDLSEGATRKQDVAVVSLYADGCFDCKHLVEGGEVDYTKCHFTRGNVHCPAQNVRIQFVGARVRWDKKLQKLSEMEAGVTRRNAVLALSDEAREIEDESLRNYVLDLVFKL